MKRFGWILPIFVALSFVTHVSQADDSGKATDSKEENGKTALQLAGLIVHAADIEKSIEFYTDVMGLKTVGRVEKEGKLHEILLSTSGKFLDGMMLTIQGATEELAGADSRPADLGTLIFMTADNEAIAKRLRRAGVEITVRDPQHLISQDPDGYRLMIYQFDSRMLNSKP